MAGPDPGIDDYAPPTVRHHYTRRTGVSLELPFDWEEDDTAADAHTAVYAWADDEDEDEEDDGTAGSARAQPRIAVALHPAPPGTVDAALRVGAKVVEQLAVPADDPEAAGPDEAVEAVEVDGFAGELRTFECRLPRGGEATVRLALFQVGDFVVSLLAILPAWRGDVDQLIKTFDEAVASIRFIPRSP